jgi:NAD(P)-dependent dehydrogenase (short-subunit alcohol dehydrogenase family)
MAASFAGKVALITGAGGGIGLATAEASPMPEFVILASATRRSRPRACARRVTTPLVSPVM